MKMFYFKYFTPPKPKSLVQFVKSTYTVYLNQGHDKVMFGWTQVRWKLEVFLQNIFLGSPKEHILMGAFEIGRFGG